MNCEHDKVYARFLLLAYPPQRPWVCKKCGEVGIELTGMDLPKNSDEFFETFDELKMQFRIKEGQKQ